MKTSLVFEYNDDAIKKMFIQMKKFFPEINAQLLGDIGFRGKSSLHSQFLSGQELNLKKTRDDLGRPTIAYWIGKRAKYVRISSYPVNLFEKGRMLRSGVRERGRHIIKRKFKQYMISQMQRYINEFDSEYLQKKLEIFDYQNYKA